MKIYFACSITNSNKEMRENNREVVKVLSEHFNLLTPEFASEENYENDIIKQLTPWEQLYEKDIITIRSADMIIADVTNASIGVGYELGFADSLNKPIVCLYLCKELGDENKLTPMIKGNRRIKIIFYNSPDDLREKIKTLKE